MHKVIFDCDNTMGVKDRDVDDGLTLLYLLGRSDINLVGVTTTFGNSTIDIVHNNTLEMFNELGIINTPLYKGSPSNKIHSSPASEFLANIVDDCPGEITLLATGSLTNLLGAYELNRNFFANLKEIVLMGGITEPLIINGKKMDELNFSCDPEATFKVLSSSTKVTVMTGQICLQALFGEREVQRLLENDSQKIYSYIKERALPWYKFIMEQYGIKGFHNWDIVASVYITHRELFDENYLNVVSTPEDLSTGYLKISNSSSIGYKVNIPTQIKDIERFNNIIFEAWENVAL